MTDLFDEIVHFSQKFDGALELNGYDYLLKLRYINTNILQKYRTFIFCNSTLYITEKSLLFPASYDEML